MRGKGINYDTGFFPGGSSSRESFDPETVRREMRIIADDLGCTAVRVSGGLPERLSVAGRYAAEAGLEVWFAPFPCEMTRERMRPYFADCADRAERLRAGGAEVVLVTGCEMSVFAAGFLPGRTYAERLEFLVSSMRDPLARERLRTLPDEVDAFLAETAVVARGRFGGRVTYAAGPWEQIDWSPFDVVAVDSYRDRRNAAGYLEELRGHFRHGKPVVVTEFGTCAYKGAADRGGMAWAIVDHDADPPRLTGDFQRDEAEQVTYLHEMLEIFRREGVEAAFWFTFAAYNSPHRADPRHDLDLSSYGVVKMLPGGKGTAYPDMDWEPKQVFHALAAYDA
ncbi:hypothetical protein [Sphaerisporangium sp. TRM90804]|uniref:hypothetical protein n=1 Tax=Sphaerisporangium sp. TRM90804 TaxID=3031113 RepID=UPI00244A2037|nr:hypothetical protein [Sphaerisporangium sp. TRM90804]MDH2424678.1 hypothetical protein [Sphaerisporangium sp. TRM90804]